MDDYYYYFLTVRGERLARTPRDDKGICSTTASAVTVRAPGVRTGPWSASPGGTRAGLLIHHAGGRAKWTPTACGRLVENVDGLAGSLNPVASRAARGQRWLNFGFNTDSYIWCSARTSARASRASARNSKSIITMRGGDLGLV